MQRVILAMLLAVGMGSVSAGVFPLVIPGVSTFFGAGFLVGKDSMRDYDERLFKTVDVVYKNNPQGSAYNVTVFEYETNKDQYQLVK